MRTIALCCLLFIPGALIAESYPGRFTLNAEKYKSETNEVYAYYVSLPWDHAVARVFVIDYRSAEIVKGRRIDIGCSKNPPSKKELNCAKLKEVTTDLSPETARAVVACFKGLDLRAPSDSAKEGKIVMIPDDIGVDVTIVDASGLHKASFSVGDSRQIRTFNRQIEEAIGSPNKSVDPTASAGTSAAEQPRVPAPSASHL